MGKLVLGSGFLVMGVIGQPPTMKSAPVNTGAVSVQRAASDALYNASVVVIGGVAGSRYRLSDNATGAVLSEGTLGDSPHSIASVAAYSSPALMEIRIRNASGETKYKPYSGFVYHSKAGATVFVSQIEDTIA